MTKRLVSLCLIALFALAAPALAQDAPDLTGEWHVTRVTLHHVDRGFVVNESPDGVFIIEGQQGRVFYGKKVWTREGQAQREEAFSGTIALDGEIYVAEDVDGASFGDLIDENHMVLYYLEGGSARKAICFELERR